MTIICAQRVDGGVLIGSDSLVCGEGFLCPQGQKKWACTDGGLWVGLSGHFRAMSLIKSIGADTADGFVSDLRARIKEDDWSRVQDDDRGYPAIYCTYLIVVEENRVFHVHGSGSVVDFGDCFCAEGSGREYAYGAAYALRADCGPNPELVMRMAIEAACKYDPACGGDVFIRKVP